MQELCNLLTNFAPCFDRAHKEKRLSIQNRQHNSFQRRVRGVPGTNGPMSWAAVRFPSGLHRARWRLQGLGQTDTAHAGGQQNNFCATPFFFVCLFLFLLVKRGQWTFLGAQERCNQMSICILGTSLFVLGGKKGGQKYPKRAKNQNSKGRNVKLSVQVNMLLLYLAEQPVLICTRLLPLVCRERKYEAIFNSRWTIAARAFGGNHVNLLSVSEREQNVPYSWPVCLRHLLYMEPNTGREL